MIETIWLSSQKTSFYYLQLCLQVPISPSPPRRADSFQIIVGIHSCNKKPKGIFGNGSEVFKFSQKNSQL